MERVPKTVEMEPPLPLSFVLALGPFSSQPVPLHSGLTRVKVSYVPDIGSVDSRVNPESVTAAIVQVGQRRMWCPGIAKLVAYLTSPLISPVSYTHLTLPTIYSV